MKQLPKEYNYVEAYLTLKCNLACSYCINVDGEFVINRKELTAKEWVDGLNDIDFLQIPITLGGGEPTVHKGFYDILDGLRPEIDVDLLTNAQFNPEEFIERTTPERFTQRDNSSYKAIRISYHVGQTDEKHMIDVAKKLQEADFSVGIFSPAHPFNIGNNMLMAERTRKEGLFFYVKDFLGEVNGKLQGFYKYPEGLNGKLKTVECRSRELLIAPDGDVYKCHRDLYAKEYDIGNITSDFKPEYIFRHCDLFGICNPCDMKAKLNRYLDHVDCQVEIK